MINIKNKSECCGCYACVNICPKKCIEMKEDNEGFWYPFVDLNECIDCGACETHCPIENNALTNHELTAYASINKNINTRMNSSSGGIFSLLAKRIIAEGGAVYGAAFDKEFMVNHIKVDNYDNICKLMGSKYVQSRIGFIYSEIKKLLLDKRLVLFTGTPCQVEGLLCFLGKDYENLICQDLICHGVPSPKIWKIYLNECNIKYNNGDKPIQINFRQKNSGWNLYELSLLYNDNSYNCYHKKDPYMKLFLNNIILRPSCYSCKFKTLYRKSDITLADFWSIEKIDNSLNDNMGTSLVLLNSEKGKKLFNDIKSLMNYKEVDLVEAIKYNPAAIKSKKWPFYRSSFFRDIENDDYSIFKLAKKYNKYIIFDKVRNKIFKEG